MKSFLLVSLLLSFQNLIAQDIGKVPSFPKGGGVLVYHPGSKGLLLIGGTDLIPDTARADVWKWDGRSWTPILASGPGWIDFSQGVSLNPTTGIIHAFAGYDMFDEPKKDMWLFDGKRWAKAAVPPIGNRIHHAMVYADHLNAFVMYGGMDEHRVNDTVTWIIKDGKFTAMKIPGPGPRHLFSMAYDKSRKKVILYGGTERSGEHWEFDGARWTKINLTSSPGNRFRHLMVYNAATKKIILHGGDPRGSSTETTWEWDGIAWKKVADEPINAFALGYDQARKRLVGYGNDANSEPTIWEFIGDKWTKVVSFGKLNSAEYRNKWMKEHPDDVMPLIRSSFEDLFFRKFAEAEVGYKKIEKMFPRKPIIQIHLIRTLLMQKKVAEAMDHVGQVDEMKLLDARLCERLANVLMEGKLPAEAAKYYLMAIQTHGIAENFYNLARAYALAADNDKAFVNLHKAIDLGYKKRTAYEKDPDLASLRDDTRFKSVLDRTE